MQSRGMSIVNEFMVERFWDGMKAVGRESNLVTLLNSAHCQIFSTNFSSNGAGLPWPIEETKAFNSSCIRT